MNKNDKPRGSFSKDRIIIAASIAALLLCAAPLLSENIFSSLFGKSTRTQSNLSTLGEVTALRNDVRYKETKHLVWDSALVKEPLHLGSSLFSGVNSDATIHLNDGNQIDLQSHSLVHFEKIESSEVPNLSTGVFTLFVNGKMKLAINGKLVEFEGKSSQIQIVVKENEKAKIQNLRGQASLRTNSTEVIELKLASNNSNNIFALDVPKSAQQMPSPTLIVPEKTASISRIDEFSDVYVKTADGIKYRKTSPTLFTQPWQASFISQGEKPKHVYAQLSQDPEFNTILASSVTSGANNFVTFEQIYTGSNYVRFSADGKSWGPSQNIHLEMKPLNAAAPRMVTSPGNTVVILQDSAVLRLQTFLSEDLDNTIVEMSPTLEFNKETTHVFSLHSRNYEWTVTQPRTVYFRVRGVNLQGQMTAYGTPEKIEIIRPAWPSEPRLTQNLIKLFEKEKKSLTWSTTFEKTRVRMFSAEPQVDNTFITKNREIDLSELKAGEYDFNLAALDSYGRASKTEAHVKVMVTKLMLAPPLRLSLQDDDSQDDPSREPASQDPTVMTMTPEAPEYLNRNYTDSGVSFEGSTYTALSQRQISHGDDKLVDMALAIRAQNWWNRHGLEGFFKSKAATAATSTSGTVAPVQAEARYHYRFMTPFSPFSRLGSSQMSLFLAYEMYRNNGTAPFSPRYDLLKLGTTLRFPVMRSFETGGELSYGLGLDQSQKYEVSGYLGYFFNTTWSAGAGYRLNLFQAGSLSSSPQGLPYREGFAEGYSYLKWSY